MRTYTFWIDGGEAPFSERHKFQNRAEAIKYGDNLFKHCSAPFITLVDAKGKVIKEYECGVKVGSGTV